MQWLRKAVDFACHSAECAPPPVGTGGSLAAGLYGKGYSALFPEGKAPVVSAPWPRAGRSKKLKDYDADIVGRAIRSGVLSEVDPRDLRSTQPSVTAPGVKHYMDGDAGLYADADRPTNKHPVVYVRTNPDGSVEKLLLSGHHRATSALLKGEKLKAIVAEGGWGPPR